MYILLHIIYIFKFETEFEYLICLKVYNANMNLVKLQLYVFLLLYNNDFISLIIFYIPLHYVKFHLN